MRGILKKIDMGWIIEESTNTYVVNSEEYPFLNINREVLDNFEVEFKMVRNPYYSDIDDNDLKYFIAEILRETLPPGMKREFSFDYSMFNVGVDGGDYYDYFRSCIMGHDSIIVDYPTTIKPDSSASIYSDNPNLGINTESILEYRRRVNNDNTIELINEQIRQLREHMLLNMSLPRRYLGNNTEDDSTENIISIKRY